MKREKLLERIGEIKKAVHEAKKINTFPKADDYLESALAKTIKLEEDIKKEQE